MTHEATRSAPTYRQRFTFYGWVGAVAWVVGPAWTGVLLLQTTGPSWSAPNPIWFFFAAMITAIAPLLILVGREYYDASQSLEAAAEETSAFRAQAEAFRAQHDAAMADYHNRPPSAD